jgi:hypothetical protein
VANKGSYSIGVTVVDDASKKIDAINKRIAAAQAPVLRVQKSLSKFADLTGLSKVRDSFTWIAKSSFDAFRSIGRMLGPYGTLISAASLAGIAKLGTDFASFAQKLNNASIRVGTTTQNMQKLQGSMALAGVSAEASASGIKALNDNLTDAVGGRAPEFVSLMGSMRIAWHEADGSARKYSDVLPQIADYISNLKNPALQARVAIGALGAAGEEMLPWLRKGSAGIAEWNKMAAAWGTLTDKQIADGNKLQETLVDMKGALGGLANTIGAEIAPVLEPLVHDMVVWIEQNRAFIGQKVHEAFKALADALKDIKWDQVWEGVQKVGQEIKSVVDSLGGWKAAAIDVAGFFAGTWLASMLAPFATLAAAMGALGLLGPAAIAALAGAGIVVTAYALNKLGVPHQGVEDYSGIPEYGQNYGPNAPGGPGNGIGDWVKQHTQWLWGDSSPAPGRSAGDPRGIRNNNPLNLEYRSGQGAIGSDGRFGKYQDMAAGVAAAERQLLAYQDKQGLNTVAGIIGRWAPASDGNDTGRYAAQVAARLGVSPMDPLNLHDASTATAMIRAMARRETGREIDPAQVAAGVNQALTAPQGAPVTVGGGAASPTPDPSLTVKGSANVNIDIRGLPAGSRSSAVSTGLFTAPNLKIMEPMPASGGF